LPTTCQPTSNTGKSFFPWTRSDSQPMALDVSYPTRTNG
jgi:hypothetical protein